MKIRNKHLVRFAGRAASWAVRGLVKSLRVEYHPLGAPLGPKHLVNDDRHIYAIWHENLLLPAARFGDETLAVLISRHADGQILGSLIEAMGMSMVLGSTNRGGIEAVRKLLDPVASRRHLAVTPDGPRGPRRSLQPGIIYIASRTGMKIVCIGVGYRYPWRAKSWDCFAVPKPTSRAMIVTSQPITVPAGLKMQQLEEYRQTVQREMDRLNGMAEELAISGRLPEQSVRRQAA